MSSAATFEIPYTSTGFGILSSIYGMLDFPYLALEDKLIIL